MSYQSQQQKGFIAITSAIIISVLLIAITVGLGFSAFFNRIDVLDSESKERSMALAEACVDTAIINLAKGSLATGTVLVGSDNCTIVFVQNNSPLFGQATIKTQAIFNKAYTNLKVIVNSTTFTAVSWQECAVGPCP